MATFRPALKQESVICRACLGCKCWFEPESNIEVLCKDCQMLENTQKEPDPNESKP
jgi:hypothetical protein